jgi:polyphosphate kinase
LDRPDLKNEPWVPVARPPWNTMESAGEQFAAIRSGDLLVHHPYDSFAASFETYVDRAAADPEVIAIKSTVYRTSDDTPLVPALIDASERGKQTVCLVEIKARGDERRNIEWSRALEQAGVHIVYGFPGLKIHGKTTLVVRREAVVCAAMSTGHGQLPPVTAKSTRTSASSRLTRTSPRTSRTSSTTSPASVAPPDSGSCSSRRSRCGSA